MSKIVISLYVINFIGLTFAAISTKDIGARLTTLKEQLSEKCQKETGANLDLVERAKNGDFVDDITFKKYIACEFTKAGAMDAKTGKIDMDSVYELLPPQLRGDIPRIFKKCDKQVQTHEEIHDKVFYFFKCYYTIDPDKFILF